MNRLVGALALLLGVTLAARGHFVFIVPEEGTRKARVVFSDEPRPDRPDLLAKIAHAKLSALVKGKLVALEAAAGKDALGVVAPGEGPAWVVGVCPYGVVAKGKEPFLLTYYARALVGAKLGAAAPIAAMKLDVVPVMKSKGGPTARVLWQGKPLAGAEVVLHVPGKDEAVTTKSDAEGIVKLTPPEKAGLYGIRARHVEEAKGTLDGKSYSSARSYATCVFLAEGAGKLKEDPAATKLLADARAARANWDHFPGFTADVEVNVEGKLSRGKVTVSKDGKVDLEMPGEAKDWARRMLASIVGHRLDDGTALTTPCAFADAVADHPLGRAIRVLNDEYHSSYRIRDRQVIEVNRHMGDYRFTITVLENRVNEDKQYLPGCFIVNIWDAKTEALKSSAAVRQTWQRVGKFDLPATLTIVTATAGKQEARGFTLSNFKLTP